MIPFDFCLHEREFVCFSGICSSIRLCRRVKPPTKEGYDVSPLFFDHEVDVVKMRGEPLHNLPKIVKGDETQKS